MGRPTALLRCAKHGIVCAGPTDMGVLCARASCPETPVPTLSFTDSFHDVESSGARGAVMPANRYAVETVSPALQSGCSAHCSILVHALGYFFLSPCAQGALLNDLWVARIRFGYALIFIAMSSTLEHPGDLGASREGGPTRTTSSSPYLMLGDYLYACIGAVGGLANCACI